MTTAQKAVALWRAWGAWDSKATRCSGCGRVVCCKRSRRSAWLCLDCWDLSGRVR